MRLISFFVLLCLTCTAINSQTDPGTPLFLTPLIISGQIDQARTLSKVGRLPLSSGVPERDSFSGFITVNEQFYSNLFFWFFPAENNAEEAPIILWLDGGPGVSSSISIFTQNGPYEVNTEGNLKARVADWTTNHSVIYLESPVGVGYGFTNNSEGYSATSEDAAINTVEFLRQFFLMFSDLASAPLIVAGESYGGHFGPPVFSTLHKNNMGNAEPKANLRGLLLLVPWVNPAEQATFSGDYLYHLGLIDNTLLTYFHSEENRIKDLIVDGKFVEAKDVWTELMSSPTSTFANATGFTFAFNALEDQFDFESYRYLAYVEKPEFRLAVHAGNLTYDSVSAPAQAAMNEEFTTSKASYIEEILDTEQEYQVIFVAGQMDLSVIHTGIDNMISKLAWSGAEEYKSAKQGIWKFENTTVAGYVKNVKNLSYYLVRYAGHFAIGDQQDWCLELINRITAGDNSPSIGVRVFSTASVLYYLALIMIIITSHS